MVLDIVKKKEKMVKIFLDATDCVLGRLAAYSAKKALEGDEIIIINAEKAIISGNKPNIQKKYKEKSERGDPIHGPKYPKTPAKIVKRTIRGMLPYQKERGRKALKRIKVYEGTPEQFKNNKFEKPTKTKQEYNHKKYLTIKQISNHLKGE